MSRDVWQRQGILWIVFVFDRVQWTRWNNEEKKNESGRTKVTSRSGKDAERKPDKHPKIKANNRRTPDEHQKKPDKHQKKPDKHRKNQTNTRKNQKIKAKYRRHTRWRWWHDMATASFTSPSFHRCSNRSIGQWANWFCSQSVRGE